jgi:hypothetical protein
MGLIKKSVLFILLVFGMFFILVEAGVAADIQTGFGGIDWGISLNQVSGCEKIEERENIQYCIRSDQSHTLLGEIIPAVLYGFYQETFFAVIIGIEDDEAYIQTKNRLVERLGVPETAFDREGIVSTHKWTDRSVQIELFNDKSEQGFKLAYYYLPIAKKVPRKHKSFSPTKRSGLTFFPTKKGNIPEAVRILEF